MAGGNGSSGWRAILYLGVVAMRDEEKEAAEKSAPEKTIAEERPVVAPTKRVED